MFVRVLEMLGFISIAIGLYSVGITVRDPAYWFLLCGLAIYVTSGDGKK